jgi:hypothetical protein
VVPIQRVEPITRQHIRVGSSHANILHQTRDTARTHIGSSDLHPHDERRSPRRRGLWVRGGDRRPGCLERDLLLTLARASGRCSMTQAGSRFSAVLSAFQVAVRWPSDRC